MFTDVSSTKGSVLKEFTINETGKIEGFKSGVRTSNHKTTDSVTVGGRGHYRGVRSTYLRICLILSFVLKDYRFFGDTHTSSYIRKYYLLPYQFV